MPARVQQLVLGLGQNKQSAIGTAGSTFLRFKKLDTALTTPKPVFENDAAEIGKGNEFISQTFPSHYDVAPPNRILTGSIGWKNNLLLNAGFFPGSGEQNGLQVRAAWKSAPACRRSNSPPACSRPRRNMDAGRADRRDRDTQGPARLRQHSDVHLPPTRLSDG